MTRGRKADGKTAREALQERGETTDHRGGAAFRALPVIEMDERAGRELDFWKDWVRHSTYDDYWAEMNVEDMVE